jgi:hypothetical protein
MNFKEFDMSEYYNVLEEFKTEDEDKVIKIYASVDKYNEHIKKFKSKESYEVFKTDMEGIWYNYI